MPTIIKDKIEISPEAVSEIYGANNSNIDLIKSHFDKLKFIARGLYICIEGEKSEVNSFKKSFKLVLEHIKINGTLSNEDLKNIIRQNFDIKLFSKKTIFFGKNGLKIVAKNVKQNEMIELSMKKNLLFVSGPAGTGKTYLSIALAVQSLKEKKVKKIILTRPAVEAGENLGFLPGDQFEKLSPYMYPLYDALRQMLTNEKLDHLMKSKLIEIVPLAYMRGRTLDKAFVILDEAQNTTINQMKMFLTRMGSNSKFIICGDTSQIDLSKNQESGLKHAIKILNSIKDIGFISFSLKDIIRHKLVKSIIEAYKN